MSETLTPAEYQALLKQPKRSKYRATAVTVDGVRFDSRGEARWYAGLQLRERAGEIRDLQRQVPFELVVNGEKIGRYVADAVWWEGGTQHVADFKGFDTVDSRRKRKLVRALYGIEVEVVRSAR